MDILGVSVDTSIHLSDVVMVGGGIVTFAKIFVRQDKLNEKFLRILTGEDGKNGLVGDVKELKRNMYEYGGLVSKIRHTAANVRTALLAHNIAVPTDEDHLQ